MSDTKNKFFFQCHFFQLENTTTLIPDLVTNISTKINFNRRTKKNKNKFIQTLHLNKQTKKIANYLLKLINL